MRSGRSCSELTLFKKDMTRFWPLWTGYTALWFLLIPLEVFSDGTYLAERYAKLNLPGWAGEIALRTVCEYSGVAIAVFYGILCAMAVWSYLYHARAVNMTHTLPVRREGHFAAHFLSGVCFFTLPHLIIFLLTIVAGAVRGSRGNLGGIAAAMGIQTLLCLFFFCFATLCAFVTGHTLALPILYGIFNFLIYSVAMLVNWVSGRFLFGVSSGLEQMQDALMWMTPVVNLSRKLGIRYSYQIDGVISGTSYSLGGIPIPAEGEAVYTVTREIEGLGPVFIYTAVGLGFAALALLLYRRRHLETAGDVVAVPWLRPVFQYGVAFCAAMTGAYITADILGGDSPVVLTVLLAIWGIIGYFAARMLLHKTLKVFKNGWKGAAVTAAVLLALCAGLWTDVLGIESRVPDASQVGAVYISGPSSGPGDTASHPGLLITDPAQIQQVLNIHRAIVAHRAEQKAALADWTWDSSATYTSLRLMYYAEDGDENSFLTRSYSTLILDQKELNDPGSLAYALNAYINDPEVIRAAYRLDEVQPWRMTQVQVNDLVLPSGYVEYVTLYSPLSDYALQQPQEIPDSMASGDKPAAAAVPTQSDNGWLYQPASLEELGKLWNAVLADFDEGNLGRRWLFQDGVWENTCTTSLEFCYQVKVERPGQEDYYRERAVVINLTPQAKHTLAAMEELGLFRDGASVK